LLAFEKSRGQKTLLLNAGAMGAVLIYGFANWDYGESSFHFKDEGWFERDSPIGGADKLGHFWASYALSNLYSYVYRKWGYTESEAILYGALSNYMNRRRDFTPAIHIGWKVLEVHSDGPCLHCVLE
jgi:hypothetical protein